MLERSRKEPSGRDGLVFLIQLRSSGFFQLQGVGTWLMLYVAVHSLFMNMT